VAYSNMSNPVQRQYHNLVAQNLILYRTSEFSPAEKARSLLPVSKYYSMNCEEKEFSLLHGHWK
jgi:hypothetical protein